MILRRVLLAAVGAVLIAAPASAQNYPLRTVRIIVPFAAGGPADIYARFLAQRLQEALGQPFIVDDRPGAGALIGTELAAKSAPDGYTLLLMSNAHTINESLIPNKPYALMKDFTAIAPINYSDLVLVVHPSLPVRSVNDLITIAKSRPRGLNYASSGTGTPYHLAGELFNSMAGVSVVHVPYKGSSEARTGVMGGQVEMMFDAITTMTPMIAAGRVRALGTTGTRRSTVLPNVPTVAEAGVPGYEATIWIGMMAPSATPKAVTERLNAEVSKIVTRPDVKKAWNDDGAEPMAMSVADFDRYLSQDIAKWTQVVKISGARVDQ
jgi:tripartite-type tricarboxylate transporter receptor subunit TctC